MKINMRKLPSLVKILLTRGCKGNTKAMAIGARNFTININTGK
jgi:hypothetical protein